MEGFGETVNLLLLDGCPSDNKKRLQLVDNVDFEQLSGNSEEKVNKYYCTVEIVRKAYTSRDLVI